MGIIDGVASILFRETVCELQGTKRWYAIFHSLLTICSPELLILGFDGIIRRLHILITKDKILVHPLPGSTECTDATAAIHVHKYHSSVVCMSFNTARNLVAVGGSKVKNGSTISSLSLWKLVDKPPFYELVHSDKSGDNTSSLMASIRDKFSSQVSHILVMLLISSRTTRQWCIRYISIIRLFTGVQLEFSPDGSMLAGLDLSGNVEFWTVNPLSRVDSPKDTIEGSAFDISWWSNTAIIIANNNGEIIIKSLSGHNLLGNPEKVEKFPAITTAQEGKSFFILEHENKVVEVRASDQASDVGDTSATWTTLTGFITTVSLGYFSFENDSWFPKRYAFAAPANY